MMRRKLILTIKGPLISRSNDVPVFGVDTAMARDANQMPYLAGSHIWGKIRDALITLQDAHDEIKSSSGWELERWIGNRRAAEGGNGNEGDELEGRNNRRLIHITDCKGGSSSSSLRTRIAIDPATGAALEGAIQVIETPWKPGEKIVLEGIVTVLLPDDKAPIAVKAIEQALNWILQMGGMGSIGFGRIVGAQLKDEIAAKSSRNIPDAATSIGVALDFSGQPFLVAEGRETPNSYVSGEIIPGGVFKGALINLINCEAGSPAGNFSSDAKKQYPLIAKYIDSIRVLHFFPSDNETRPSAVPLSSCFTGNHLGDAIDWHVDGAKPVFFSPDWKHDQHKEARINAGWPEVTKELRVRTEIDPEFRAAKAERLFGFELCRTHGHNWLGQIDLYEVDEKERGGLIAELADALSNGLPGIGRTKTFAHVHLCEASIKTSAPDSAERYIVELQSSALIRTPDGTYETAFDEMSGGSLECEQKFVRERLAGAEFFAMRYFREKSYRPYLLSEAGCVFVLSVIAGKEAEAKSKIKEWISKGLEFSDIVLDAYGSDGTWKSCPYIRENGYGEIHVREEG